MKKINISIAGANGKMGEEAVQKIRLWNSIITNRQMRSDQSKHHQDSNGHRWKNKKHTDKSKEKMASHDRSGAKSPSFGKIWIHNTIESRKIPKEQPIPDGFIRGKLNGTTWIHNGIERKFIKKDAPLPEGFVYGKLYRRKNRLCP